MLCDCPSVPSISNLIQPDIARIIRPPGIRTSWTPLNRRGMVFLFDIWRRVELRRIARSFALAIWPVIFLVQVGCEPQPVGASNEERAAIENVAKWYQIYKSRNRNRPPKDEAAFLAFIEEELAGRDDNGAIEEILVSPRDGEKYIVLYGKDAGKSRNMDENVAVYEQKGAWGTKLVAFEAAWAKEVSDSELESLLAGEQ